MEQLVPIISTVIVTLMMVRLYEWWCRIKHKEKKERALKVLKKHGLEPEIYLATIGIEDQELRNSLDEFTFTGHIIKNRSGEVIGGLVPKIKKQRNLRLVISNKQTEIS